MSRHSGGYSPDYYHWFGWNGLRYVDNSDEHTDFYQRDIDAFIQRLKSQNTCYDPRDLVLETILFNYAAMRRLEQGWAEIEPLLHWDTCTADELKDFGDRINGIKANITAQRF